MSGIQYSKDCHWRSYENIKIRTMPPIIPQNAAIFICLFFFVDAVDKLAPSIP